MENTKTSVNWAELFLFYFLAVVLSAPFRLDWLSLRDSLPLPYGLNNLYSVFKAIGPLTAYGVVTILLRSRVPQATSLLGLAPRSAVLAFLAIPIGLGILGIQNNSGLNPHYFGIVIGLSIAVYALFEEYGWRGYLQPALYPLSFGQKILLISVMWYLWHLNFLRPGISVQAQLIHYVFVLAGTIGLYFIAERTRSLMVCTAGHALFNIFELGISAQQTLLVAIFTVVSIVIAMRSALKKSTSAGVDTSP